MRAKLPIVRCLRVQRMPEADVLGFPSHVPHVSEISHRKVPLCAYGSHHKVLPYAKFPIPRCHRVPRMPVAWCICVPSCPLQGAIMCLNCPFQSAIVYLCCPSACVTMCPRRLSHGSLVCQSARLRVPRWPSEGAILCQVALRAVPLCSKLAITRCHYVPSCSSQAIACQVAHRKVPLRTKLHIARCHCMPMFPITRCHFVA